MKRECQCGCRETFESLRPKRYLNRTHARRAQRARRGREQQWEATDPRRGDVSTAEPDWMREDVPGWRDASRDWD